MKSKTMKKGQISLFIIIGTIIVLIAFFGFSYFNKDNEVKINSKTINIEKHQIEIKNYVSNCLKETGEDAIYFIGKHGGSYDYIKTENDPLGIQLYSDGSQQLTPTIFEIQEEISKYINNNIDYCADFIPFRSKGIPVLKGTPETISILSKTTKFNMIYPISLNYFDTIINVEDFSAKLTFNFKEKYEIIEEIVTFHTTESTQFIDFGYIHTLSLEKNFRYEVIPLRDNTYIISLIFKERKNEIIPFIYNIKIKTEEIEIWR